MSIWATTGQLNRYIGNLSILVAKCGCSSPTALRLISIDCRYGDYRSAEPLYRQSIDISRKAVGEEHPHFVGGLSNLGLLYRSMGNYKAAEPLYRKALEISRRSLGEEHPDFAQQLNNMA